MKIFVGYESEFPEAYGVCRESILRFNDKHEMIPLVKEDLEEQGIYTRKYEGESTEFAFTRFLVPYLCNYEGFALFCDGDFLWRTDPDTLLDYKEYACVQVVKHPVFGIEQYVKMHDKVNKPYPKKYWSSLMYINCDEMEIGPTYVNSAPAGDLHGFKWTNSVGSLPATYNNMVGYYDIHEPKAVHFTDGGPWLKGYEDQPYAEEWRTILNETRSV